MKNPFTRLRTLPIRARTLLTLGVILAFTVALPLYIWAVLTQRFELRKKAAVENLISDTPVQKKIFLLIFNPIIENQGGVKLTPLRGWNDPDTLTNQLISTLNQVSNNYINYNVTLRQEVNGIFVKSDGYQYTDDSYLACLSNPGTCHQPDIINYQQLFNTYDICNKNVDEVWLWGGPYFGYWEYNPVTYCGKTQFVMGFNYERGLAEALHDFGHRMEFVGNNRVGDGNWQQNEANEWNKFSLINGHCGNVHYPPGTSQEYQYDNRNDVASDCNAYLNYPGGYSTQKLVNCSDWNCNQEGYLKWWLTHIPHNTGVSTFNGKTIYNNWWKYYAFYDETQGIIPIPTTLPTKPAPTFLPPPTAVTPNPCARQPNGTSCYAPDPSCPVCIPGQICPKRPCKIIPGTCQNNQCVVPLLNQASGKNCNQVCQEANLTCDHIGTSNNNYRHLTSHGVCENTPGTCSTVMVNYNHPDEAFTGKTCDWVDCYCTSGQVPQLSWTVKLHPVCENGQPLDSSKSVTAFSILYPSSGTGQPVFDALAPGVHTLNITSTEFQNDMYVGLASDIQPFSNPNNYTFVPKTPLPDAGMFSGLYFFQRYWVVGWHRTLPTQIYDLNFTAPASMCAATNCPNGGKGNLNCDASGLINAIDLSILLSKWRIGACPAPTVPTGFFSPDLNGDCNVNAIDLSILLNNWKSI